MSLNTNNILFLMRAIATFSLLTSFGLAYMINPIEDSFSFQVISGIINSLYGVDVVLNLNNSVVAGMIIGLLWGTLYVFISINKEVHDYTLVLVSLIIAGIFLSSVIGWDSIQYAVFQQIFLTSFIGIPILLGIVGVWDKKQGNQIMAAFLILIMPLGLTGNTNQQIYLILGFVFSFLLFLELSYGHIRYSRLARIMHYSKEYEMVLQWFLTTLVITLVLTTALTSFAFLFHNILGDYLPYSFSKSIEYNTIYGQALSVLVFFMLWATVQTLFSRRYLARQVED